MVYIKTSTRSKLQTKLDKMKGHQIKQMKTKEVQDKYTQKTSGKRGFNREAYEEGWDRIFK